MSSQLHMPDDELERRIGEALDRLLQGDTIEARMAAWEDFKQLHAMRSPERVEQMEREIGI